MGSSEPQPAAAVCRTVLFRGNVQGVGFRYTTYHVARGFRVTGYVRNLADGRVELVAEGARDQVDSFVLAVQEEMGSLIGDMEVSESPATGAYTSFDIRM